MIEKIIPDRISLTLPTVFGDELTFLEFCGKLRAKLNECIDVVNENTTDIQQNASAIQQNASAIQQNTAAISADKTDIEAIKTALNTLRYDFRDMKVNSLFAPVILNVETHSLGADINASVYIRMGRIDWQGLGCLYAKINLSFSGATDAKTLKINSVQFGDRKAADITSVSTSFTAKTEVINLPISIVGTSDTPAGTSDISVTGINLLGMSIVAESLASSFSLESIPTGIDIPCESLTFTSPAGGEEDTRLVYTFKASEGCFDIFTTSAGIPAISERAQIKTDFTSIISNSKVFTQFLCSGGAYNKNTISSVPSNGASMGAALMNYTEFDGDGEHVYTARATLRTINAAESSNRLDNTGIASQFIPYGEFAHISLTFDMFN